MRSAELTLPGFVHDVCSAIHPLAAASPFFRSLPLAGHGLEWARAPAAVAHPLDGRPAAVLERSIAATGETLAVDAERWARLMAPLARDADGLAADLLRPLRLPRRPLALARFAAPGVLPATSLARTFRGEAARALLAGLAAHSQLALERATTSAYGLVLGLLGHANGWPFPRGGAQRLADALASYLRSLGGTIETGAEVTSLAELGGARCVLLDFAPRWLGRRHRYGPGAFKLDWALDGPIPWRDATVARAATVHLGGTLAEIAAAEREPWRGRVAERPFVILAQHTPFDRSRAPAGKHTAWAYCHVPNGSSVDMTARIEAQVERFAPGFRERILARSALDPAALERHDPNYVGGDVNGGVAGLRSLVGGYATRVPGVYLCSSATPPGGGVHGMCGFLAARAALRALNAPDAGVRRRIR
jgi:phytoene dehydrogenase-like protein